MAEQTTLVGSPGRDARQQSLEGPARGSGAPNTEAPARSNRLRMIVILLVVVAAGIFVWREFFATPEVPEGVVALSGRIEGDDSAVAPKTAGRILEVRVREGDTVKAGSVIAILDDEQVRAREQAAKAALTEAEDNAKSANAQIAILQDQLQQNKLLTDQAVVDANGRVSQAQATLAAAQSTLAQQQAADDIAQFDKDAYTRLAATGAVSERQGKQAAATADQTAAAVAAAKQQVSAAQGALGVAQANLANPGIRGAQVSSVEKQIAQQQAQIAGVNAAAEHARDELMAAEADRQDLTVAAPFDGTVMTRAAEPGEVVQAGTAIVTLLDLSKVYLRGFIPEGDIGRVRIGQPAHIFLDSNTKQAIDAAVIRIDPQATFTPENTYFRDDRVKQVVGVKVGLQGAIGFAKPGMPADGEILVDGNTWPKGR
jgi:HlyD family secretion protein